MRLEHRSIKKGRRTIRRNHNSTFSQFWRENSNLNVNGKLRIKWIKMRVKWIKIRERKFKSREIITLLNLGAKIQSRKSVLTTVKSVLTTVTTVLNTVKTVFKISEILARKFKSEFNAFE